MPLKNRYLTVILILTLMVLVQRTIQLAAQTAFVVAVSSFGDVLADAPRGVEVKITTESVEENVTKSTSCDGSEDTCSIPENTNYLDECGIWLAPSTLPGAGLGIFAGRDFEKNEQMLPSGDVVIPIVDIMMHQRGRGKFRFLWDEYTWNGKSLGLAHEVMKECNAASPGFGAAANSFLDLVNIEEWDPINSMPSGLHRSKDAGVGAFSTYHDRKSTAKLKIGKGQELFVNYGQHWFEQRSRLGPIPLRRGLQKSTAFYRKFKKLRQDNPDVSDAIYRELWDEFVKNTEWSESRIIGAFTNTESEREMLDRNMTLKQIRLKESIRPSDWLKQHGTCADHMREGVSTIRQAGRGAFATRSLPQGAVVSHLPLIPIYDRTLLEMYELKDIKTKKRPERKRVGYQLLTNYCAGHVNSTMLLCPYAPIASLVNHNQTNANVKLMWADPEKSNHRPELLEKTVDIFMKRRTSELAMDLVATRDIAEGDELFLDYGDAWEKAWQEHVQKWNPEGANEYVSAFMLNDDNSPFRTEYEQIEEPYPGNINVECDSNIWKRINHTLFNTTHVVNITKPDAHAFLNCDVLRRRIVNGTTLYSVVVTRSDEELQKKRKDNTTLEEHFKLTDIPSMAIRFTDRPYTSDMFLKEAFRHAIMIPDDLFPKLWMNYSPI